MTMRYSVWNYATRSYDYYDTAEPRAATHANAPPSPILASSIGATPEQGAWRLPAGARKVGSGPRAQGRIASMGDVGFGSGAVVPIAIGVGVLAYFLTR